MSRTFTVLVADNDVEFQASTSGVLLAANYRVETAVHASEVLTKVADGGVDILIMEVHLPGNEDFQLIPIVHKLDEKIPIIAITEDNSWITSEVVQSKGGPVFFYDLKPVATGRIKEAVDAAAKELNRRLV